MRIDKEPKKVESRSTLIIGSILIIIGVLLLWLQMFAESISAILISGILFIILGIYDVISFYIDRSKRKEQEYETRDIQSIKSKNTLKRAHKQIKKTKYVVICSMCGEEYPSDTIHTVCVACGSPLEIPLKNEHLSSKNKI
jgi:ribosomal protein L32